MVTPVASKNLPNLSQGRAKEEPERLQDAVNRFGKPIAFDFSTS